MSIRFQIGRGAFLPLAGSYAMDEFCDATNLVEGQSIVPPHNDNAHGDF